MSEQEQTPDVSPEANAPLESQDESIEAQATEQEPTAPEPAYAQHINPEIQLELDRFGRHVDSLTETVLESADLANRSAMATTTIGEDFKASLDAWNEINGKNILYLKVLVAVGGVVMFVASLVFMVSALRVGSRVSELDTMLLAVGKRVVELNASTQDVTALSMRVQELNAKQEGLIAAQERLAKQVGDSLAQTEAIIKGLPGETAKQLAASGEGLAQKVDALGKAMDSQAAAVKGLGASVSALKSRVGNVTGLQKQVEAIVTLEKDRYLETLQQTAAQSKAPPPPKPKPLAYPPPKPTTEAK
jgi:uncharacterized protein YoxC